MLNPCLAVAVAGTQMVSQITSIDWFVIAIYFGILLIVAWWVVRKAKTQPPTIFLRAAIWAGGSSAHPFSLRTSAPSTSSDWPAPAPPAALPSRITNCMPGVCWCWPGSSCRFTCVPWCSPCRSFWSVASAPASRYVLSIVSHHHFYRFENCGRHLCRWRGFWHAAAGDAHHHRRIEYRQLLDRLRAGHRADRPLHRAGRHARGRL